MHFYFCHSRAAPMRLGTMEMRPCGVKRLANMYTIACGVFLARTHPIAPSSHLQRSFMALLFSLPQLAYGDSHPWRRFPCTSTSARAPSASPPLIRNFLFATLFPAAFSLHELIPLHRARTFTALSWHCSFLYHSLPTETHTRGGVFLARTHPIAPSSHLHRSFMALLFQQPFPFCGVVCVRSLPLYGGGRFARDVVDHSARTLYLVHYPL